MGFLLFSKLFLFENVPGGIVFYFQSSFFFFYNPRWDFFCSQSFFYLRMSQVGLFSIFKALFFFFIIPGGIFSVLRAFFIWECPRWDRFLEVFFLTLSPPPKTSPFIFPPHPHDRTSFSWILRLYVPVHSSSSSVSEVVYPQRFARKRSAGTCRALTTFFSLCTLI